MRTISTLLGSFTTVLVLCAGLEAQWSIDSSSRSRSAYQNPGTTTATPAPGYATSSQQNGPGVLSVPQVMPVVRSRSVPMISVFETDGKTLENDKVMKRLDAERKRLTKAMRAARRDQNMAEASRLLRELEDLRQDRLERMRRLAPPAATPKVIDDTPDAKPGKTGEDKKKATPDPVLPLPTRPGAAKTES